MCCVARQFRGDRGPTGGQRRNQDNRGAGAGAGGQDRKKTFSSGGAVGARSNPGGDQRRYNDGGNAYSGGGGRPKGRY